MSTKKACSAVSQSVRDIQLINRQFIELMQGLKELHFDEACFFVGTAYCSFEQALALSFNKHGSSI